MFAIEFVFEFALVSRELEPSKLSHYHCYYYFVGGPEQSLVLGLATGQQFGLHSLAAILLRDSWQPPQPLVLEPQLVPWLGLVLEFVLV